MEIVPGLLVPPAYGWPCHSSKKMRDKVKVVVERLALFQQYANIDSIAFCGSSGAAVAFPAAYELDLNLIYVRKKDEHSHGNSVEMNGRSTRYVIVDDLMETGATIKWIKKQIDKAVSKARDRARIHVDQEDQADQINLIDCRLQGIVLYDNAYSSRPTSMWLSQPVLIVGDRTDLETANNMVRAFFEEHDG